MSSRSRFSPLSLPHLLLPLRFAAVGLLGTALDFTLFLVLHSLLHWHPLLANVVSYSAGIVNNYTLHRAWTFAARPRQAAPGQFARFAAASLGALLLNSLVVLLLTPTLQTLLPQPGLAAALAKLCATAAGLGWNFFAAQRWVFARG